MYQLIVSADGSVTQSSFRNLNQIKRWLGITDPVVVLSSGLVEIDMTAGCNFADPDVTVLDRYGQCIQEKLVNQ